MAIKNSQAVRRSALLLKDAAVDVSRATSAKIPSFDAGIGHGLNFGRSIDPSTNDFINERITRGGMSAQASLPLWQAGNINHTIKQAQYAQEASRWALKNEEDNLRLQVTLAYMQLLNNKELANRGLQQEEVTREQVQRLQNLNVQGAVLPHVLTDMQGQYAVDQMNTVDAKQAIRIAKLTISQLMNIPFDENTDVVAENSNVAIDPPGTQLNFERAFSQHAFIKSGEFQIKSAESSLSAVKAQRYPRLMLGADFGSNYSSAYTIAGEKVGYPRQLSNNFNYAGYFSLGIPILDNYRVRSNIRKAEHAIELAHVNMDWTKNTIQQRIEEAKLLQKNAIERYTLIESQVKAFSESFRIGEIRFNEGAIHAVEYLIAKNNLDRAQNQLITSKYEWAFRNKILEFYSSIQ